MVAAALARAARFVRPSGPRPREDHRMLRATGDQTFPQAPETSTRERVRAPRERGIA
jgi:hypothetical protein